MDWYKITGRYHTATFPHDGRLTALPEEWQRELAALWRLEADVNNGAYLQFLANWGHESYVYARQGLIRIGAARMAEIVDACQGLVDKHVDTHGKTPDQLPNLMPNPVVGWFGGLFRRRSALPRRVIERIYELSYEFMDYPDDIPTLGLRHYGSYVEETGETPEP